MVVDEEIPQIHSNTVEGYFSIFKRGMTVERIYWDSDCFIAWFNDDTGKAEFCDGV